MPHSDQNPATSEPVVGLPVLALPAAIQLRDKGDVLSNHVYQDAASADSYYFDLMNWLRDGEYLVAAQATCRPAGLLVTSVLYSRSQAMLSLAPGDAGQAYFTSLSIRTNKGRVRSLLMLFELVQADQFTDRDPDATGNVVPDKPLLHAASVIFNPETGTEVVPEPLPKPALVLTPISLAFPNTPIGITSSAMTVTMANTGQGFLDITGITTLGNFKQVGIWPTNLAPGASVPLSFTFSPAEEGQLTGTATIVSNDPGSPAVVQLRGLGLPSTGPVAGISLSPSSINFPNTQVGQPAAARQLTITSTGTEDLTISNITVTGDFSRSAYTPVLAPGASTTVSIGFTPTVAGNRGGTLTITSNAPGSPHTVAVAGVGEVPTTAPFPTFAPTSLSFPLTEVGETSPPLTVTLTNTGTATLNITSLTASGDYMLTAGWPTTLSPGASTTLTVRFSPAISGTRSGVLSLVSNAVGSPHNVPLTGQGHAQPGAITWLTADGSLLRDEGGNQVMLRSINWFGFEQIFLPQGLWEKPYKTVTVGGTVYEGMLDLCARLGFNSMRLPLSQDVTWAGSKPVTEGTAWNVTYVDPTYNPDLFTDLTNPWSRPQPTLTSIEILDRFVAHARTLGMRIILDLHCLAPDNDNVAGTGGKWYTTATPGSPGATAGERGEPRNEQQAIDALVFLANRYKDEPVVCGIDLINEPHNCTWDRNPNTGVVGFYERAGAAIQNVNPKIMLICEGITGLVQFGNEGDPSTLWDTIWSGKLDDARATPVVMPLPNKLIYSPHEYGSYLAGFAGAAHPWFEQPNYPTNMPEVWRRQWGYLAQENIAPLWIGEFGSWVKAGASPGYTVQHEAWDAAWLNSLADYCNTHSIGFAYWALNPQGEPDGLLSLVGNAWGPPYPYKVEALEPFLHPTQAERFYLTNEQTVLMTDENGTQMTTEEG